MTRTSTRDRPVPSRVNIDDVAIVGHDVLLDEVYSYGRHYLSFDENPTDNVVVGKSALADLFAQQPL